MSRKKRPKEEPEATAEESVSFEPQAVYFDTSILYDVRFNGHRLEVLRDYANHLKIPMLVPEIAVQELMHERQNEAQEFEANVKRFNSLFPDDLYHLDLPGKPQDLVAKGTRILLESLDVKTISLPENLSLNYFIDLALHRVPPFEQGDKGFKDTLVLETVVRDMKHHDLERALLMAVDKIFRNGSITARLEKEGIRLLFLDNIDAAEKCLYSMIEKADLENLIEYQNAAVQYFKSRFREIAEHILRKLDATEGNTMMTALSRAPADLPSGATLNEVNNFTPLEVTDAHPWKFEDVPEETDETCWLISVETEFDLRITYYTGFSTFGVSFSLAEAGDLERARYAANPKRQEMTKKVKRTVTVEATVKYNDGVFSELKLRRSWVHLP